jgi:uncharacterized repeat protein (TIGR01451 family)
MGRKQLGLTAAAVVLVVAACEPAPTPWDVELVSVNAAGTGPGNYPLGSGSVGSAVWSADGSVVAFSSPANDLAADDDLDDAAEDVYVRDLETGVTTRESPHPSSDDSCCTKVDAVSADGTKVLFHSTRSDLTSLPDPNGRYDYFVRDRVAETTTVVSVDASGERTGNDASPRAGHNKAFMTPDGNKVAFTSGASDLVFPRVDATLGPQLYVRDLAASTTTHVASNVAGLQGFSADGTRVLFWTREALVPEDGNGVNGFDLYLGDLTTGTFTLVSVNADGTAAGASTFDGSLTPDGEQVLFTSASSDVVPGGVDTNGAIDVFLRDLSTGTTRLVSTNASGTASTGGNDGLLSPDESKVVYETGGDLYVKDLDTGSVTLVTPRRAGDAGDATPVGFTGDGRVVVFSSDAGNFGPVDDNGTRDVYARDLVSGTTHLVSVGSDGVSALGDVDSLPGFPHAVVSPTGRRVLFLSREAFAATLPLADVAVTGSVEASGEALTYRLTVSNGGPDSVEDVKLALVLPEGTSFSGATTTTGTCEEVQTRVVTCGLGDAEGGVVADVAVSATVQAPSGSLLEAIAAVGSATYEAEADNNIVTLTSNVA